MGQPQESSTEQPPEVPVIQKSWQSERTDQPPPNRLRAHPRSIFPARRWRARLDPRRHTWAGTGASRVERSHRRPHETKAGLDPCNAAHPLVASSASRQVVDLFVPATDGAEDLQIRRSRGGSALGFASLRALLRAHSRDGRTTSKERPGRPRFRQRQVTHSPRQSRACAYAAQMSSGPARGVVTPAMPPAASRSECRFPCDSTAGGRPRRSHGGLLLSPGRSSQLKHLLSLAGKLTTWFASSRP